MIKAGDIVTLKSGSPKMTVDSISGVFNKTVLCHFWNEEDHHFDWVYLGVEEVQTI